MNKLPFPIVFFFYGSSIIGTTSMFLLLECIWLHLETCTFGYNLT